MNQLDISFGIITDGKSPENVDIAIGSIQSMNGYYEHGVMSDKYEIIVCGGERHPMWPLNIKHIPFDETVRPGWITRKKNIIAAHATKEFTCLVHDYYAFDRSWYKNWCEQDFFYIGTNKIYCMNGNRHSDWTVNPDYMLRFLLVNPQAIRALREAYPTYQGELKYICGIPYDAPQKLSSIQYISGGFIFARTHIFAEYPLDETLTWGQDEDVQWSEMVKMFYDFKFNPNSSVRLLKPNKWELLEIPMPVLIDLAKFYGCNEFLSKVNA
jgi:hypothetical protein